MHCRLCWLRLIRNVDFVPTHASVRLIVFDPIVQFTWTQTDQILYKLGLVSW